MTKMIRKISMVGVCMALTGAAQAALITNNFTSAEGFTAGALNNQQGWIAGTSWAVDPAGSGKATITAINQSAVYTDALQMTEGQSLTFRTEFKMLGVPGTPGSNVDLFRFGVQNAANTSSPTGNWALIRFLTDGNLTFGGTVMGTIAEHGSASLAAEYTLTVGEDAASSLFGWKLINIDTAHSVSGSSAMSADTFNALTGSGAYTFFRALNYSNASSGVTGMDVFSTTVIPEPATIGMLGLGMLLVVTLRRLRS